MVAGPVTAAADCRGGAAGDGPDGVGGFGGISGLRRGGDPGGGGGLGGLGGHVVRLCGLLRTLAATATALSTLTAGTVATTTALACWLVTPALDALMRLLDGSSRAEGEEDGDKAAGLMTGSKNNGPAGETPDEGASED